MGIYDAESFFCDLEQLHERFSDIGAHQDFQKSKLLMPELFLKELWVKRPHPGPLNRPLNYTKQFRHTITSRLKESAIK